MITFTKLDVHTAGTPTGMMTSSALADVIHSTCFIGVMVNTDTDWLAYVT